MAQSIKQLHAQIQAMPSDSVKAIVLLWLNQSNGNLSDFERLITEIDTANEEEYQWGEIDTANEFQPLSAEQTIAQSLAALQDYQKSKIGIGHDRVKQWADSLGSDRELPCPQ